MRVLPLESALNLAQGKWTSQSLVGSPASHFVGRLELLRTHTSEMAVAAGAIVERHDVVGHVRQSELAVPVDLLMIRSFFRLLKKDSATALSQQFPRRLILGSRWLSLHQRLNSSLPN